MWQTSTLETAFVEIIQSGWFPSLSCRGYTEVGVGAVGPERFEPPLPLPPPPGYVNL